LEGESPFLQRSSTGSNSKKSVTTGESCKSTCQQPDQIYSLASLVHFKCYMIYRLFDILGKTRTETVKCLPFEPHEAENMVSPFCSSMPVLLVCLPLNEAEENKQNFNDGPARVM